MINLNNKGQSLVMFILIIPILLFILIIVYDVGNAFVSKQELDNVNYLTIEYGLEHIDDFDIETELIDMININNMSLSELDVLVENDKITIKIKKNVNGILAKGFSVFSVESNYVGYFENGKKIIERV